MEDFMDRYEALCRAARDGRIRYEVRLGGEVEGGFETHREAELWALENRPGLHFRVVPYVLPLAA